MRLGKAARQPQIKVSQNGSGCACALPRRSGRQETRGIVMYQKDAVIVGYAETKIVDKSDRDIWELSAEILEKVIIQTGIEKDEIDGLVLSSSMTAAGSVFWSQTNADMLGLDLKFPQTVDIGGCAPLGSVARAVMAITAGLCTNVLVLFSDTQATEA